MEVVPSPEAASSPMPDGRDARLVRPRAVSEHEALSNTAKPILREAPILPYLASTLWMQNKINLSALKPRDYTRCLIESNSPEGMVLTVPVVGGAAAAKRLRPEQLEVSGHGDWTRIHLGAIEAAYGREPYFQHLFPEIAAIITHYPQQLAILNVLLMEKMMDFIGYEENLLELKALREEHPQRCANIERRLESKIDSRHSFLEPLFRLGTDALFLL